MRKIVDVKSTVTTLSNESKHRESERKEEWQIRALPQLSVRNN